MALVQEYAKTERELKSGRWPTRKEKAEVCNSELPMSSLEALLEHYGFLFLVTNDEIQAPSSDNAFFEVLRASHCTYLCANDLTNSG